MKTLYMTTTGNMVIDPETNTAEPIRTERQAITSIFLIKEPMHIVLTEGEYKKEVDAKANSLVIKFYASEFKNKFVLVDDPEWLENINEYNEREQKMKEAWAEANEAKTCCPSESC